MAGIPGLDALRLALFPVVGASEAAGPFALLTTGTINIIGGGSGGTAMVDNSAFTPGSTSITPAGGYHGGRSVASGNAAAFAIDGSGNMQVNVVAGGAGGGVANITVRGSANSDLHVGYASGAAFNQDGGAYLPILGSVNVGGVVGSVNAVLGTLPVPMVGSVNVQGSLGVGQLAGPWTMVGSVNVTAVSTQTVTFGGNATVWYGGIGADTANSAIRVNVVAGAAGGGVANLEVQGTANTAIHVGFASGAGLYADGGAAIPILGTTNIANNLGVFGSINVLGTTTLGAIPTVWYGGLGADTANSAIRVNVVAGGAGGGVANLEVQGTANTAIHVGFASGAGLYQDGGAAIPVLGTVNVIGGGGFATVGVYGSVSITGSVWIGGIGADTANSALRVNVVAGGAGGGVANLTVRGTGNTDYHIGYASNNLGAWPNYDGGAWLPVMFPSGYYPTINSAGGGAGGGFATVAVYGSPGFPVYNVGSVNVVNNVGVTQVTSPWVVTGSVNITGSINPVGIFGSLGGMVGSVSVTQGTLPLPVLGSLAGVGAVASGALDVDPRANLIATQWIISFGGSGQLNIAGSIANQRVYFSSYHLVATATVDLQWNSPSGAAISGAMRMLPGAGFALAGQMPGGPVLMGSLGSQVFISGNAVGSVGGVALGWIGT